MHVLTGSGLGFSLDFSFFSLAAGLVFDLDDVALVARQRVDDTPRAAGMTLGVGRTANLANWRIYIEEIQKRRSSELGGGGK